MRLFNRNKSGHEDLEKWYMRIYGSVHALKHINNLSEKQKPVFDELEINMKKFEDAFDKHKNETSHYDMFDTAWLITRWLVGVAVVLAATKSLWQHLI